MNESLENSDIRDACAILRLFLTDQSEKLGDYLHGFNTEVEKDKLIWSLITLASAMAIKPLGMSTMHYLEQIQDTHWNVLP